MPYLLPNPVSSQVKSKRDNGPKFPTKQQLMNAHATFPNILFCGNPITNRRNSYLPNWFPRWLIGPTATEQQSGRERTLSRVNITQTVQKLSGSVEEQNDDSANEREVSGGFVLGMRDYILRWEIGRPESSEENDLWGKRSRPQS